ncbi:hypothetical protein V5O48_012918, partial [Marasmius crinis-equi]
ALQGVIAARAIVTPINTRLKPHEVIYILEHSDSKLILIDHEYLHLIEGTGIPYIISNDTGKTGDPYENFLSTGRKFSDEKGWPGLDIETDEEAGAILSYTSGTTGRPKGVLYTLRGTYLSALQNALEADIRLDSTYLWVLPMFHAGGWTIPYAITLVSASQITIRKVDYSAIWKHFISSGATHYCAAPTVQVSLLFVGKADPAVLTTRKFQIGIANHPSAQRVPRKVTTITYGPATNRRLDGAAPDASLAERSKYMAKQGHIMPLVDNVRVVYPTEEEGYRDDSNELIDVPWDSKTVGEVVMRGNLVMKEYFKDPEATQKASRGGFFHSGDLAVVDPDGSITVLDRSKDIIISGGEVCLLSLVQPQIHAKDNLQQNASSIAIEQELSSHPAVIEVSVVARSHPKWGERPMAFVVLRPRHDWEGREDEFETELIRYAKTRLPGFACPEWVKIVKELPKNGTGKILKTELRKAAAEL